LLTCKLARMRFNDGAVDSHGRFWAGSCNDDKVVEVKDQGTMFRLDPDGTLHRMVEQMIIPNGTGWNAKDDTMYLTDSPRGIIWAYDFNAETGDISNRRVHFQLDPSIGEPDGFAQDEDDCIWIAVWRGSRVIRINPEGKIIGEISLPTRHVTCAEFVGTELYITTAAEREPEKYPESARYGGRLFKVDVGIKGKPRGKFHFKKE
jgi:sugar lactone lactonase YvrE